MLHCSIGRAPCMCQSLVMLDAIPAPPSLKMQRAHGRADVVLKAADGRACLGNLHQSGSAKAFLPEVHSATPEVVFLNSAGGLPGGDKMQFALSVAPMTRATGTTQTAERAYASAAGVAEMQVDLSVGRGAHLDWLPQETILFQGAGLHRKTEVTLKGYSIPLEQGITVTHFLLSTFPLADCYYCMPGGPESFVEVKADDPIAFTYAPLTLRGTFAVLEKEDIDQLGMFYRMTSAKYLEE